MKYKKWNFTAPARPEVMAMAEAGLPVLAALVLCARGVDTPEKARAFFGGGRPSPARPLPAPRHGQGGRTHRTGAGWK